MTSHLPPQTDVLAEASLADRVRALEAECAALRAEHAALALGLSHEMRAPLRAIESFTYLAEQRGGDALDDTARDHLRRVREAGAHAARLASRLQAYLNAGSAPLHRTPVDLTLLADWCIAELRDASPAREADITLAPDLHATGDERLLKRALQELLHNAWTYARPDAPLVLHIEGEHTGEGVHVRLRDNGIGFDAQHAGKLGEPFQRLHVAEYPAGTGLGLAIAQRILARHGGTLRIEAEPNGGAIAHIWLPDDAGDRA